MSVLAERIRERMEAVGTNPHRLSLAFGARDAVRMILSGRSKEPRMATLLGLSKHLQCDVRYLMGETDEPGDGAADTPAVESRVRSIREARGWSQARLAQEVGTSQQTIERLERGETEHYRSLEPALSVLTEDDPPANLAILNGRVTLDIKTNVSMEVAAKILVLIGGDKP